MSKTSKPSRSHLKNTLSLLKTPILITLDIFEIDYSQNALK